MAIVVFFNVNDLVDYKSFDHSSLISLPLNHFWELII